MVFSSSTFLFLFLPIVLACYYLLHPRFRNFFLLIASLGFYSFGEPKFVIIIIYSIIISYIDAIAISKCKNIYFKKIWLTIGIILNLFPLTIFKYMNFITRNAQKLFPSITITSFALPIGISFFTFQAISYIIDVYRGKNIQKNPFNLALYISFFPQLVAGPIVRYETIVKEIENRNENYCDFAEGTKRFIQGLAKKVIIANNLAIVADTAFKTSYTQISTSFAWLGAIAYMLQIYFDFSGYSDMAIGLGKMFGFHFLENFNYPYLASSITDFWRRWHISLSSWFRDYVYFPLGGSRVSSKIRHIFNLFVVWLLTGIWHGASWNFIIWGLIYFVMLVIEKYAIKPNDFKNKISIMAYKCFSLMVILFCWVIFRANGFREAYRYIKAMFGLYGNNLIDDNWLWYSREYAVLFVLAILLSTPFVSRIINSVKEKINSALYETMKCFVYIFLFIACVSYLVTGAHNPFIYFNF